MYKVASNFKTMWCKDSNPKKEDHIYPKVLVILRWGRGTTFEFIIFFLKICFLIQVVRFPVWLTRLMAATSQLSAPVWWEEWVVRWSVSPSLQNRAVSVSRPRPLLVQIVSLFAEFRKISYLTTCKIHLTRHDADQIYIHNFFRQII